jgi:N-acetylglucosamine-6-phosphate deacetylase
MLRGLQVQRNGRMTSHTWLLPIQVFDGTRLLRNHAVQEANGTITALSPAAHLPAGAHVQRLKGTLTPGYIDLQVNGGGGVLINTAPTTETLHKIRTTLYSFGTTHILPTVITDAPDVLSKAVDAAIATAGTPGLLGLHIEGPHISQARRGTHASHFIRPLDANTIVHVRRLREANLATMVTLAPEAVTPGQVAELTALGAIVSIGHSDATSDQVQPLLAEGASCFTHLFNAMSPMQGRAPGVTGAAINSTAYCGFICDGHHVLDEMLALAIRARPKPRRMFLVSDCMATVGGADHFTLYGQTIRLAEGRLVNAEGSLAGAHVTMAESVARLIARLKIAPAEALAMATSVPAAVIGQPALGALIGRAVTDTLVLDENWLPAKA